MHGHTNLKKKRDTTFHAKNVFGLKFTAVNFHNQFLFMQSKIETFTCLSLPSKF